MQLRCSVLWSRPGRFSAASWEWARHWRSPTALHHVGVSELEEFYVRLLPNLPKKVKLGALTASST